jgi:SUMO ligase MMS21 Smc5/6 complex component
MTNMSVTMNTDINMNLSDLFYYDLSGDLSGTYLYDEYNNNKILPNIPPVQKRVADIVIAHAIQSKETCPITMEPISPITASVTSCYHTFDTTAIQAWLTTHTTCPQCRTTCVATQSFEEN